MKELLPAPVTPITAVNTSVGLSAVSGAPVDFVIVLTAAATRLETSLHHGATPCSRWGLPVNQYYDILEGVEVVKNAQMYRVGDGDISRKAEG
jgi:hypothetical protein